MSKINFIPCVYWIKKGVSKQNPNKIELTKEDLKRIIEEQKRDIGSDDENENQMSDNSDEVMDDINDRNIIERYDLDNYEDGSEGELGTTNLNNLATLTVYGDDADDPYLEHDDNQDETEENDDFCIKASDNLFLVGHVESDASSLEVYVYSEDGEHYCHHDIILPAYPICFEWINFCGQSETTVNHLGIGDMTKDISIWDIDTVNSLEPVSKLIGHKDAVLDLSWNSILRKIISSGSADKSCCIWDLETSQRLARFSHFQNNVQSLQFHPFEAQTLLVGDSAGNVSIADCQSKAFNEVNVCSAEIEKVIWNHFNPYFFFCSTSDGYVFNYDVRNTQKPIYQIQTHNDSVTGLALSSQCNGCLITASTDKTVKVWDVLEEGAQFIAEFNDLNVGSILSLSANPDLPFTISVGGDNNKTENFKIIDISKLKNVRSHFDSRISKLDKSEKNND